MEPYLQYLIKILLATLLGGLIGAEREARDKSAGFRTMILISVGSALFTMLSLAVAQNGDPTRIASGIVTGIGFLGAGAIMRNDQHITGLTTAATIWLVAAIGLAVGAGRYGMAAFVTLFTMLVLWVFPAFESKIDSLRHTISYVVVVPAEMYDSQEIEQVFTQHGLKVHLKQRSKKDGKLTIKWEAFGTPTAHDAVIEQLLQDSRVLELGY